MKNFINFRSKRWQEGLAKIKEEDFALGAVRYQNAKKWMALKFSSRQKGLWDRPPQFIIDFRPMGSIETAC